MPHLPGEPADCRFVFVDYSNDEQRRALLLLMRLARGERELQAGKGIPHDLAMQMIAAHLNALEDA